MVNIEEYIPKCYIADFGSIEITYCNTRNIIEDFIYTAIYRAPEIYSKKPFNNKSDIWALGLVLLEYLIGYKIMDEMLTFNFHRMIGQTLEPPQYISSINNGHVNVTKFLQKKYLDYIQHKDLISMLQVDPNDRVSINQLISINNEILINNYTLKRGHNISGINIDYYYEIINILISKAEMLKLSMYSLISGIDLFDRYISNYKIDSNELQLIGIICLWIVNIIIETEPKPPEKFIEITDNFLEKQILIGKQMNFMIITCDVNNFIQLISNDYQKLRNFYKYLHTNNYLSFELSYVNIESLFHKYSQIIISYLITDI